MNQIPLNTFKLANQLRLQLEVDVGEVGVVGVGDCWCELLTHAAELHFQKTTTSLRLMNL